MANNTNELTRDERMAALDTTLARLDELARQEALGTVTDADVARIREELCNRHGPAASRVLAERYEIQLAAAKQSAKQSARLATTASIISQEGPGKYSGELIEKAACAAHEANRVHCASLGDNSQVVWRDAPAWQRESAILGVHGVIAGNTPEQSHEGWLAEKVRTGWKYGPVKDPAKKEHPCMVPHDRLPSEQRHKDVLFVSTVRRVLGIREEGRAA